MNYENLLDEAVNDNLYIIENLTFDSNSKGLIKNDVIALSRDIQTSKEKACVLAEELGHYYTSVGHIIDLNNFSNSQQEQRARLWGYNKLIGLCGLIDAYKAGCRCRYEIADYLDVTEDYLEDAITKYTSKYGTYTIVDNFVIYFIPNLGVMELI